jgi:hypothetical protein
VRITATGVLARADDCRRLLVAQARRHVRKRANAQLPDLCLSGKHDQQLGATDERGCGCNRVVSQTRDGGLVDRRAHDDGIWDVWEIRREVRATCSLRRLRVNAIADRRVDELAVAMDNPRPRSVAEIYELDAIGHGVSVAAVGEPR